MDFRAQRYRDRLRAEGRWTSIRTARRTRDILDGYVETRKGLRVLEPRLRVLWGRILFVALALGLGLYAIAHYWG